jgi:cbb3-type cytochrome oxidase subunit 3
MHGGVDARLLCSVAIFMLHILFYHKYWFSLWRQEKRRGEEQSGLWMVINDDGGEEQQRIIANY